MGYKLFSIKVCDWEANQEQVLRFVDKQLAKRGTKRRALASSELDPKMRAALVGLPPSSGELASEVEQNSAFSAV